MIGPARAHQAGVVEPCCAPPPARRGSRHRATRPRSAAIRRHRQRCNELAKNFLRLPAQLEIAAGSPRIHGCSRSTNPRRHERHGEARPAQLCSPSIRDEWCHAAADRARREAGAGPSAYRVRFFALRPSPARACRATFSATHPNVHRAYLGAAPLRPTGARIGDPRRMSVLPATAACSSYGGIRAVKGIASKWPRGSCLPDRREVARARPPAQVRSRAWCAHPPEPSSTTGQDITH